MCLGIPARIVAITDAEQLLAEAEVSGVRRVISVACIADGPLDALVGTWTILHAGFGVARIGEAEAAATLAALRELDEIAGFVEAMRAPPGPVREPDLG